GPIPPRSEAPVANELLVERGLRRTRCVLRGGPEARGGRSHGLVGKRHDAVAVDAELELRVRQEDSALFRMPCDKAVDGERRLARSAVSRATAEILGVALGDVDVVALGRLRGRSDDGPGQAGGLAHSRRKPRTADLARREVVRPAGSREVAADDDLD